MALMNSIWSTNDIYPELSEYDRKILAEYNEKYSHHMKIEHIIAIAGPSGAGKSGVFMKIAIERFKYELMYNLTSRPKRQYEIAGGSDYYHVSDKLFSLIPEERFITGRRPGENNPYYYGLLGPTGKRNIIALTPGGIEIMRRYCQEKKIPFDSFFIYSSPEVCEERMRQRGDSEEVIKDRLAYDAREINLELGKKTCDNIVNTEIPLIELEKEIDSIIISTQKRVSAILNSDR